MNFPYIGMYKNQLQELAQRSCFNLPSYSCIREGPDHAPRFKSTVNFNGETFESPTFCSTLRQAEHAAAEVALTTLATRGPSRALAAKVLDETGVFKNLLQETAHRAGLSLPVYATVRSGPGHVPVFSCTVELAGLSFRGEPAKTKKQAQKNAAMVAWSTLKQLAQRDTTSSTSPSSPSNSEGSEEQEQAVIARVLANLLQQKSNISMQSGCSQDKPERSTIKNVGSIPQASKITSYPMQYETWAYSGFATQMEMYQMWQQPQLQGRVLPPMPAPPLPPVPPLPLPNSQVLPFMRAVFQPDHLYFMSREHGRTPAGSCVTFATPNPSFHLSNHSILAPIRVRPAVIIQEIQEEKTEEGSSKVCPSEVSTSTLPGSLKEKESVMPGQGQEDDKYISGGSEAKTVGYGHLGQDPLRQDTRFPIQNRRVVDDGQKSGDAEAKQENSGHPGRYPSKQATHFPDFKAHVDIGFQAFEFKSQKPQESSPSNVKVHFSPGASFHNVSAPPLHAAPPVRIRTSSPASFAGPTPQNFGNQAVVQPKFNTGVRPYSIRPRMEFGMSSRFMAPAVQIRSVVPVCSAPPARKMPSSSLEGQLSGSDTKNILAATSELHNLHLGGGPESVDAQGPDQA